MMPDNSEKPVQLQITFDQAPPMPEVPVPPVRAVLGSRALNALNAHNALKASQLEVGSEQPFVQVTGETFDNPEGRSPAALRVQRDGIASDLKATILAIDAARRARIGRGLGR